jgi:copper chaperone CopZ
MVKQKSIMAFMILALAGLLLAVQTPAIAATKTVLLRTPACVCGDTAQISKIVLSRVEGVKSVDSNPVAQTTTVVYDDTKTNPQIFVDLLKREGISVLGKPRFIE